MTNYARLIRATVAASNQRQRDKKYADGGTPVGGADEFYDPYEQEVELNRRIATEDAEAKRRAGMSNLESVHELLSGIPRTIAGIANETPQATPDQVEQWGSLATNPYLAKPAHVLNTLGHGLVQSIKSGFTLPGDVAAGRISPYTPEGESNPELVHRAFDTAALAGGTSAAGNIGSEGARMRSPDVRVMGRKVGNDVDFDTFMQRVYGSQTRSEIDDFIRAREAPAEPRLLTGPQLASDSGEAGRSLAALERAPRFYSALERAVDSIQQPKMTGAQWLGTLGGKAVKPEEMKWTGLGDYLFERKDTPVTKAEVQAHLGENKLELGEVNKGHQEDVTKDPRWMKADAANQALLREYNRLHEEAQAGFNTLSLEEFERITERQAQIGDEMNANHDLMRDMERASQAEDPLYQRYSLPGGENYRERLMTLPTPNDRYIAAVDRMKAKYGDKPLAQMPMTEQERAYIDRQINDYGETGGYYESKSHWPGVKNPLFHRRSNERSFTEPLTPEQEAVIEQRRQVQGQLNGVVQQQHVVARQIGQAARPLNAAYNASIQAELKAGQINHIEALRRMEQYPDFPELKPLQDKLQELRAQEDAIRKAMPEEPKPNQLGSLHIEEIQSDWHQAARRKGQQAAEAEGKKWKELSAEERNAYIDRAYRRGEPTDAEVLERAQNYVHNIGTTHQGATPAETWAGLSAQDQATWLREARAAFKDSRTGGLPDAPFKKNWHELALKDAIREAAEKGLDRISWTPGSAQNARYGLSNHLDKITAVREGDTIAWWPVDKNGKSLGSVRTDLEGKIVAANNTYGQVIGDTVDAVFGKEFSTKVLGDMKSAPSLAEAKDASLKFRTKMKEEGRPPSTWTPEERAEYERLLKDVRDRQGPFGPERLEKYYSGLDLEVGGEGMKGFYDKMLVDAANKIGKQYGVKVQKGQIGGDGKRYEVTGNGPWVLREQATGDFVRDFNNKETALKEMARLNRDSGKHDVWYMDLPKELKDEVLQKGFSLFEDSAKAGAPLTALARAKAQGFDTKTPLYHGTSKDKDFQKFKDSRHGTWTTTDPKEASGYAIQNDSKSFRLTHNNPKNPWEMEAVNDKPRVLPLYGKPLQKPYDVMKQGFPKWISDAQNYKKAQSDWFDQLKSQGYDGVIMPGGVRVDFNNANLRSQFAQFDPKNAGKSGLLLSDTAEPGAALAAIEKLKKQYGDVGTHPKEQALTVNQILDPKYPSQPLRSRNVEDIAADLEKRGQKALRGLGVKEGKITGPDPRTDELLSRAIATEIKGALGRGKTAEDWYTHKIAEAMEAATQLHPELKDPLQKTAFTAALAITSQGETVASNVRLADWAYDHFKKTGRFPTKVSADKGMYMAGNFVKLNGLLDTMGPEKMQEFLNTEFTVKQLNELGFDVGKEKKQSKVFGSAILGPKIGQGFFQNLNGNYTPVTMDLWFMRAWGRLTGTLVGRPMEKPQARFEEAMRGEKMRVPNDPEKLVPIAEEIMAKHEKDFRENRKLYDSGKREKSELTMSADRYLQNLRGINETPSSGGARDWMRSVVNRARDILEGEGHKVTNADLQAIWWYPEKELYGKLGGRDSETINVDYATAFQNLLKKRGAQNEEAAGAPAVRSLEHGPGRAAAPDDAGAGARGGAKGPGAAGEEAAGAGQELKPIRAYHGSPHEVERFDISKVGTGEDNLVRGHGLYFTGAKKTAEHHGKELGKEFEKPGRLYDVNLNVDPSHLLDWEEPLGKQSKHVQEAMRRAGIEDMSLTGKEAYTQLSEAPNTPQSEKHWKTPGYPAASAKLRDEGIPGIRYLDNDTPASKGKASSYVMFDDKQIGINKSELISESTSAPERAAFDKWFKGSKVVDDQGKPLVVYRGEHGDLPEGQQFHSRLNSLSFSNKEAAHTYAMEPNNWNDKKNVERSPRVAPVYLQIKKPFIENRDDPFVDLSHIEKQLGRKEAMRIAHKFADDIQYTNNWEENYEGKYDDVADLLKKKPGELKNLYFDLYKLLDDPHEVELMKKKGFDGAIHIGNGETATELEYRVFDPKQVKSAIRGFARGGRVKPLFDASQPYFLVKPPFDPAQPFEPR